MTVTRKMAQEVKDIINKKLDELALSLASKDSIEGLRSLILEQNQKILKQNEQISSLQNTIAKQDDIISKMEDKLCILSSSIENIKAQSDNNEQYSRRYCLRISGIDKEHNESSNLCLNKVVEVCKNLDINIDSSDIDRAHRVGKDKRAIIVKFFSFKKRTEVYKARKKENNNVKIYLNLTKARLNLLDGARSMINVNSNIEFVFADINCNPVAKLKNGSFVFFNNLDRIKSILAA